MTKGQSTFLFSALGVILVLGGGYCVLEDYLYHDPRPWPLPVLLIGAVLLAVCVLSHINSKKQRQADAEAEARRKAEAEERVRKQIEAEEAELERLRGSCEQQVIRLTHCLTDEAQAGMGFYVEGMPLRLVGDEKNGDSIWVFNDITGCRIGQLPKEAAARVETVGAVAVYSERSELEAGNRIPFVRVFWRKA